jgi:hypothetical protein
LYKYHSFMVILQKTNGYTSLNRLVLMAALLHCIARQHGQNPFSPLTVLSFVHNYCKNHDNTAKVTSITFCSILDKQVRFHMGIVGKATRFKTQVYVIIELW